MDRDVRETGAAPDAPGAEDLVTRAVAAHLVGDGDTAVSCLQEAYRRQVGADAVEAALRSAFLLALIFGTTGRASLFNGWFARARRLLDELPAGEDRSAGRGYVAALEMHRGLDAGEFEHVGALAAEVATIGRYRHEPDLTALGLVSQGRHAIYAGDVPHGLALLDEAMAGVLAGEVADLVAGLVFCAAIEGCQEIGAIDRMCQWTTGLTTWCDDQQPGITAFAGECALHTGQVLRLRGAWTEAIAEFAAARARYDLQGQPVAAGCAEMERGDLLRLRGDLAGAAAAYETAAAYGCDPQPGLAQLWVCRGRPDAATAAVRRTLAETLTPARRAGVLPASVDVLLGVGLADDARELVDELDVLARVTGCAPVAASVAYGRAVLELARDDAAAALPEGRRAAQTWGAVGCPFEVARSQVAVGRALTALGDDESAKGVLRTARSAFESLGAAPSITEVDALLVGADPPARAPAGLTSREVEVLRLVAAGSSNRQIASALVLSERTVARHLSNIFTKLGVGSRTGAAAFAYENGLV